MSIKSQKFRLDSLTNLTPHPLFSNSAISIAGFYNEGGLLVCYRCGFQLSYEKLNASAINYHKTSSAACAPFQPNLPDYTSLFSRLFSFLSSPPFNQLDPCQLAKSGYSFVGPLDTIQCNCGMKRHPCQEGETEFLRNMKCVTCFSVNDPCFDFPDIDYHSTYQHSGLFSLKHCNMKDFSSYFQRLFSFSKGWPYNNCLDPSLLARCGYYYTGFGDIVACSFCERRRYPEDEGADTFQNSLACPDCLERQHFVEHEMSVEEARKKAVQSVETELGAKAHDLSTYGTNTSIWPVPVHQTFTYQNYILYNQRLASFSSQLETHVGEDLAQAGFFYLSFEDKICCFACGLKLRIQQGIVLKKHKLYSPSCPYLPSIERKRIYHKSCNLSKINDCVQLNEIHKILLEKENKFIKQMLTCKICHTTTMKVLFLPCGDLLTCSTCATMLSVCPFCEKEILTKINVNLLDKPLS